ncbi:MAG: biotin transporter BioY [Anaerolineales bacterium]
MNSTTINNQPTIINAVFPIINRKQEIFLIFISSWLIAMLAQISIPLQPVPLTGQTFAVLLVAALLGKKRGALTVMAYLAQGALGLPVFAGGTGGILHLIGPSGGYLFGFILAAFIVGWLSEIGWDRKFGKTTLAMLIGNSLIYGCGLPWLANFIGWHNVLRAGFYPFILGDILKIILAATFLPGGWILLKDKEINPNLT